MLNLKDITIEGYKSYDKKINFNFAQKGLWRIYGKNGVGKTNLIEAIGWCLTGKTFKNLKVDQVINWKNKKNGCSVILKFSIDSINYKICRYRKHKTHKNSLYLYKGKTKIVDKDIQKEIDDLVGLTWEEMLSSVLYSAEDFQSFIEQTPLKRQQFLEHIFQLDRFDFASEMAINDRRQVKRDIVTLEERERGCKERIENSLVIVTDTKTQSDQYELQRKESINRLETNLEELKKLNLDSIKEKWILHHKEQEQLQVEKDNLTRANQEISNVQTEYQKLQNEHNFLVNEVQQRITIQQNESNKEKNEYDRYIQNLNNSFTNSEMQTQQVKVQATQLLEFKNKFEKSVQELLSGNEKCQTCGQSLPDNLVQVQSEKLNLKIDSVKSDLEKVANDLRQKTLENSNIAKQIEEVVPLVDNSTKLKELHSLYKNTLSQSPIFDNEQMERLKSFANDIKNIITPLQNTVLNFSSPMSEVEIENTSEKIKEAKLEIKSLQNKANPYEVALENAKKQLKDAEVSDKDVQKEIKETSISLEHINYLANLFRTGIKASIMNTIIPTFNHALSTFIESLFPECSLEFDSAMNLKLTMSDIDVDNSKSLSTGQRARINFAICMSVYETLKKIRGMAFSSVFFDEVLDFGLDEQGQQVVFDLLRDMGQTVYVISHRDAAAFSEFDGSIEITRTGTTEIKSVK